MLAVEIVEDWFGTVFYVGGIWDLLGAVQWTRPTLMRWLGSWTCYLGFLCGLFGVFCLWGFELDLGFGGWNWF